MEVCTDTERSLYSSRIYISTVGIYIYIYIDRGPPHPSSTERRHLHAGVVRGRMRVRNKVCARGGWKNIIPLKAIAKSTREVLFFSKVLTGEFYIPRMATSAPLLQRDNTPFKTTARSGTAVGEVSAGGISSRERRHPYIFVSFKATGGRPRRESKLRA